MNARRLAVDAVDKILENKSYSNIVVNDILNKFELSLEDKRLFTNLVYGTLQNLLTIQYYLEPYFNKKKPKHWVKHLLFVSVYQLVYLNLPDYAVVNEAVAMARVKDQSIASFINGVLRNFLRNPLRSFEELKDDEIMFLSIKYSCPSWLVAFFLKDYDYNTVENILKETIKEKHDAIRVNTLKTTKDEVLKNLISLNIKHKEIAIVQNGIIIYDNILNSDLFKEGKICIQDISSQMVAEIVAPEKDSQVLDLCSAPGGKAAHMSAIMENTGRIFACDVYQHKLRLMKNMFKNLGVTNVVDELVDARQVKKLVKTEVFDYVLADVPCSGLGVISHKVDLKYHISLNSIDEIKKLQQEILESTFSLVKPLGYYIYSTCTINKDENEYQIREFLKKHPSFEIVKEVSILPTDYETDGFYICKMRRNS